MAVRRYGVLDADGVKITVITADEELIKSDWYPGFGAALIDEGPLEPDPPPPPIPTKPDTWGVLSFSLAEPMINGDRIDFKTGEVTKVILVDPILEVDPVIDIKPVSR